MAEAAVDSFKLGHGKATDFLGISFSALDTAGHAYGPRSHEVQDVLVRLDTEIGKLLAFLDAKVGADNYVLALSSDHGVAAIPEQAANAGRQDSKHVEAAIETALKSTLGDADYVETIAYTDIYLRKGVYDRIKKDSNAMTAVKNALTALPRDRPRPDRRRHQQQGGARVPGSADSRRGSQLLRRPQRRHHHHPERKLAAGADGYDTRHALRV